jgi:hypothetical protein
MDDYRKREIYERYEQRDDEHGKVSAQPIETLVTGTENLYPAGKERSVAELDENKRQAKLRKDERMIQELGKEHQQAPQRRGFSQSQEALTELISIERASPESQYPAYHEDEIEKIKLQARLKNKARKRAEIVKEIERLGLTEQITLPSVEAQTSPPPASKMELTTPPNADIARDTQGGRRKLRKKRGLPSLLAPKSEPPGKEEFSNSPPNQLKKENLASRARGALQKLRGTLSPPSRPSTPARTEPPGTDPSVVDTKLKIDFAREARRNLVAAAKYYETPSRSSSLKLPTSLPADLERKIELARKQAQGGFLDATSNALSGSFGREERPDPEIDMRGETQKKVELATEAKWKFAHGAPPEECSTNHESLKFADFRREHTGSEFDHASDTQKKIELAREVRRRLEEEKAKGIPPALSSPSMLDCKHWLRYDLCRICSESEADEGKE